MKLSDLKLIIKEVIEESNNQPITARLNKFCDTLNGYSDTKGMSDWYISLNYDNAIECPFWKGQGMSRTIKEALAILGLPKPKKIVKENNNNDHTYVIIFDGIIEESTYGGDTFDESKSRFEEVLRMFTGTHVNTKDDTVDVSSVMEQDIRSTAKSFDKASEALTDLMNNLYS